MNKNTSSCYRSKINIVKVICICFFLRQIRLEKELKSLLWKIDYSEIMIKRSDSGYSMAADDNLGLAMEIQVETT